jgi:hypothetical protein
MKLPLAPERLRLGCQLELARAVAARPGYAPPAPSSEPRAEALLITERMAPAAHRVARATADAFGIDAPIELYQSRAGHGVLDDDNAAIFHSRAPVRIEVKGRLLVDCNEALLAYVFGHELGHYLDLILDEAMLPKYAWLDDRVDPRGVSLVYLLRQVTELTADRYQLLAVPDLASAVRFEMQLSSGLRDEELADWDTDGQLERVRALKAEGRLGRSSGTHPNPHLRTYALALFAESDLYRALTGLGAGARTIASVDAELDGLLGARAALDAALPPRAQRAVAQPGAGGPGAESVAAGAMDGIATGARRLLGGIARAFDEPAFEEPPADDEPVNLDDLGDDLADRFAALERKLKDRS